MIVTITPNTGIDHTLVVPEFTPNKTIRARERILGMGGKATDVSWILGKMGIPSLALGFAAGPAGHTMQAMLLDRGVQTDFVWAEGETRINIIIVCDDGSSQTTFTVPTLSVSPQHLSQFERKWMQAISSTSCLVVGGTLPKGVPHDFYMHIIHEARQKGIPVLLDASGSAMQAGLRASPTLIKPNRAELEEIVQAECKTLGQVYRAAQDVQFTHGCDLVVTLGDRGALAVIAESSFFIPSLKQKVISTAGAGDGVLAGLALAYAGQKSIREGLHIGFALASAIVLTPTTADFLWEDYRRILPLIEIQDYKPAA
jgi:1-phosphofructokinase family hexose kinase